MNIKKKKKSKGAEAFTASEVFFVTETKKISSYLDLTKEDHATYVPRTERDVSWF